MYIKNFDDKKIIPLKVLRMVLDKSAKEFAEKFGVTTAYISSVENGTRVMRLQTLAYGLMNLEITIEQYNEFVKFYQSLLLDEFEKQELLKLMFFKAYSVLATNEEEKNQIESLINVVLNNKERKK